LKTITLWLFVLLAATSALLTACGETSALSGASMQSSAPLPAATRTPLPAPITAGALLPPPGQIYFGAYVNTSGLVGGNTPVDTASLETQLGRSLALHMQYEQFTANFSGRALQDDFVNFRIPIVSIDCGATNAQIISGAYDATLRLKADEAKNFAWPAFVRFFWDPNLPATQLGRKVCYDPLTDRPNNIFDPTEYKLAWAHIRAIFAQDGAVNVVWLWTVSATGSNPLDYYPGDSQVDWVGVDNYDLSGSDFVSTFSPMYAQLSTLNKPIMITETGAPAAAQTAFFGAALEGLTATFPRVQAFTYYDAIDYAAAGTRANQDWRVTTAAFSSFSALANYPYLAAYYGR